MLSWSQSNIANISSKDASSLPSYPLGSGWCVGFPSSGRIFVQQCCWLSGNFCGASTELRWLSFWDFVPTDGWPGALRGLDFVCPPKSVPDVLSELW